MAWQTNPSVPELSRCWTCGFAPEPSHLYCAMCGNPLEFGELAERRSLTVLFCDLVGSTSLSVELDPEELRERVRQYQSASTAVVDRLEGYVAQYLGDGLLVYFGYPRAHEDDARRAVLCALELVKAVPGGLQVRIGLHSGAVVVGEMGGGWRRERLAIGDVPNVAARLQGLADPGTVLISHATRLLCRDRFELADLGETQLKGIPDPVPLYRVLGPRSTREQIPPSPFVGRGAELGRLQSLWETVSTRGFVRVDLTGDAGLGKTRLVRTFCERIRAPILVGHCSPFAVDHALFPVKECLRSALGLPLACSAQQVRESLPHGPEPIVHLLSPEPEGEAGLAELLDVLVDFLSGFGQAGPVVLVLEDAQWLDPSTLRLLSRLRELSALLLVTARAPLDSTGERIELAPLALEQIEHLLAGAPRELALRCDGNPLFAEELARAARSGQKDLPGSLQGLLLAQLDRMPRSRRLAQVASVIGRHFPLPVLERLWGHELEPALSELVTAGVLESWGDNAGFRHALMQEAAYQTMLHSDRRPLHGQLARLLQTEFPALSRGRPEMLARHFETAGLSSQAHPLWQEAARHAIKRGANAEALRHLDRALQGADTPERELELLSQRIAPLIGTEGYASEEVARIAVRAQELSLHVADAPFAAMRGLWAYLLVRSRLDEARALATRLSEMSAEGPLSWRVEAELAAGVTDAHRGELESAQDHLERALAGTRRKRRELHFGQDPNTLGRSHLGWVLAHLGRHDEARAQMKHALASGRGHPFSQITALVMSSVVGQVQNDPGLALRRAVKARSLCVRHDSRHWLGLSLALEGWARCRLGQGEAGLALVRDGYEVREQTGARLSLPHIRLLEALCLQELGRAEEALATAREGLAQALELGQPAYRGHLEAIVAGNKRPSAGD